MLWGTGTCGGRDHAGRLPTCPLPLAERGLGEEQQFWLSKESQGSGMPVAGKGDWAGMRSKKEQISQHCAGWGAAFQEELKGGGGGGEPTPTQKYPPKKSSLLVPVLEGGLQGAATCSTLGQNLLVPVLERGLHGAATRSTPGQGPKRCPQPRVPPGHPNRGTTRSASPAAALRAVIPSRQDPERGEEEEAMDQSRRHSFQYLLLPEAREVQIGRSPAASIA